MSMRMKTLGQALLVAALTVGLLTAHRGPIQVAHADGMTYYLNNQSNSNCNNSNPGTSPDAPWCDFAHVDTATFAPGDHILLACGASWTEPSSRTSSPFVTINGSGSLGNNIVLDAYDPANPSSDVCGPRPQVFGNDSVSSVVIWLNNPSYWTVQHLEVGHAAAGIRAFYTTLDHSSLTIDNIYVHDVKGVLRGDCTTYPNLYFAAGIVIDASYNALANNYTSTQVMLDNVTLSNIEGTHNQESVHLMSCDGVFPPSSDGGDGNNLIQHVTLSNLNLHDDTGSGSAPGCAQGLALVQLTHVLMYDSILSDEAGCHTDLGTAAILLGHTSDVTLVNNILANTPDTGSNDETAVDYEVSERQTRLRDNYIGGNAGAGVEILAIHGGDTPPDITSNVEVSGNLLVNNGTSTSNITSRADIARSGDDLTPTGVISNNLYTGLFTGTIPSSNTGDFSGFTYSNNQGAVAPSDTYNAAHDFQGPNQQSPWSYQYSGDGGDNWRSMTYNSSTNQWSDPDATYAFVSQFDQHPGPCDMCYTARTWTAPYTGTISIRGRVFKANTGGGDGIRAQITQNGATVWASPTIAYNDQVGVVANVDSLSVTKGDMIRFIVDPGPNGNQDYDLTSWDPSIAYVNTTTTVDDSATGSGANQFNYCSAAGACGAGSGWVAYTQSGIGLYNNTQHYDNTTNDYATFQFSGRQVVFYGTTGSNRGYASVSICDVNGQNCGSTTSIDQNLSQTGNVSEWTSPMLSSGTHTLRVSVAGTKDSSSSNTYIAVDRVDVYP